MDSSPETPTPPSQEPASAPTPSVDNMSPATPAPESTTPAPEAAPTVAEPLPPTAKAESGPASSVGGGHKLVWTFVVVAVLLLVGVAAYMVYGRSNSSDTTPTPTPKASVSPSPVSDSQVQSDLGAVDSAVTTADQSAAAVDSGLNDQQGNLAE